MRKQNELSAASVTGADIEAQIKSKTQPRDKSQIKACIHAIQRRVDHCDILILYLVTHAVHKTVEREPVRLERHDAEKSVAPQSARHFAHVIFSEDDHR